MKYIRDTAKAKSIEINEEIDAPDVAEVMLSMLDDVYTWLGGTAPATPTPGASATVSTAASPRLAASATASTAASAAPAMLPVPDGQPSVPAAPTLPAVPEDVEEEEEVEAPAFSSNKSHNKRQQCLQCPFFGTHLLRHLLAKHREDVSKREIPVLVANADRGEENSNLNPNSQRCQCALPGCNQVVTPKGQYIMRYHKIVDKQEAKEAAKTFTKLIFKRPAPSAPKTKCKKPCVPSIIIIIKRCHPSPTCCLKEG